MRNGWFGLPLFGRHPVPKVVSCTISGGGARASFQIGALQYLYRHDPEFTPTVFVGASAGAIVAAGLAQYDKVEQQSAWVDGLREIWMAMESSEAMFTPRAWYRKLLDDAPSWLQIMQPPPTPPRPASRLALPFLRRETSAPTRAEAEPPYDPLGFALTPEAEVQPEWNLQQVSAIASHLGKLPRLGSDVSAIWTGLERTQSMYRPGPVLQELLEPAFFRPDRVASSGMRLRVAMVALESGELRYMTEHGRIVDRDNDLWDDERHDLTLGLLASCSIPGVFRAVPIDDETYVDGGTRENLPAELAVGLMGASRNYVVSSQVGGVARRPNMAADNVFSVVMRSTEILIDEAGRDELEYAISAGARVIYPEVNVHDAMTVQPELLRINADYGWMRAAEVHLALGAEHRKRHRRLIEQRVQAAHLRKSVEARPGDEDSVRQLEATEHAVRELEAAVDPRVLSGVTH